MTSFVKHHAATIAAFAVSAAVFAGCDAALGIPTGGVGALAGASGCSALAGAAGNAVSYGITAAQTGHFSWTGLADSAATGALAGAAGGMFGGLAASGLSVIGDAATSLLSDGAQSIADDASSSLAATGTDDTAALASPADSADISGTAGNANLSDASDEAGLGPSCGGRSFTAGTKVLLATGAAVPIAKLHRSQKVLATNTHTGKTRPQPITAVLAHHDTNRYNLTLHTTHGTAVIHTTRTHLFWAPTAQRWIKAAALHHGTHLQTTGSGAATATGGHNARNRSGWMWDLTIPHNHDFYVTTRSGVHDAVPVQVLVHNENAGCDESLPPSAKVFHVRDSDPQDELPRSVLIGQGQQLEAGDYHYVVMENGEFRAAQSDKMYSIARDPGHTSLSQSEPVIMAGHFNADTTGSITEFDNWSGHYWPQDEPGYTPLEEVSRAAFGRFGMSEQIADATWSPISYGGG